MGWKKKNKNTKRKVTEETKREVYERDGGKCVCCSKTKRLESVPHHAWFGALETNYGENRNDPNQLVTICMDCHAIIHRPATNQTTLSKCLRELCKDYVRGAWWSKPVEWIQSRNQEIKLIQS